MEKQRKAVEQTVILKGGGKETQVTMRNGVILLPKGYKVAARRAPARSRAQAKAVPVNLAGLKDAPDYGPRAMTQRLVNALGNNAVAALLGVNKDRPSRWVSGQDAPNEENRAQLADLDSLVGHLHTAFTPAQARLWLEGQDPYLNARPIDVYRLEGAAPVIEAIRAFEQGAFA
jgi:plasmid stabilization system protein ParE